MLANLPSRLLHWIKSNFLLSVLSLVVLYVVVIQPYFGVTMSQPSSYRMQSYEGAGTFGSIVSPSISNMSEAKDSVGSMFPSVLPEESVDLGVSNRKVVRNSNVSLLVKDVRESENKIEQYAVSAGGFLVNSSLSTPEQGGSGNMSIRVPSDKLKSTLEFLRSLSVRVVSENVMGTDITDQYSDTQARIATLTQTKRTFEAMMERAQTVDEILKVQRSIFQIQDQLDALQGQLQYMEKTSQSSLVTIYLSTDELSLPYSPSDPWRPDVIFKTAVRSLLVNAQRIGSVMIWGAVYSPVIIAGVIVYFLVKRRQ